MTVGIYVLTGSVDRVAINDYVLRSDVDYPLSRLSMTSLQTHIPSHLQVLLLQQGSISTTLEADKSAVEVLLILGVRH